MGDLFTQYKYFDPDAITVEVHYRRSDGLPTYAACVLTTQPSIGSNDKPILVVLHNYRTTDHLVPGTTLGPADLPAGTRLVTSEFHCRALVEAGYSPVEAWDMPR